LEPELVVPRTWVCDEDSFGMSKKLYVGNLPFSSTEEELRELFGRHGSVTPSR